MGDGRRLLSQYTNVKDHQMEGNENVRCTTGRLSKNPRAQVEVMEQYRRTESNSVTLVRKVRTELLADSSARVEAGFYQRSRRKPIKAALNALTRNSFILYPVSNTKVVIG